jgi:hypothetical protein
LFPDSVCWYLPRKNPSGAATAIDSPAVVLLPENRLPEVIGPLNFSSGRSIITVVTIDGDHREVIPPQKSRYSLGTNPI